MTNLTENSVWESGVFQLEVDTPTLGGPPGFDMGVPVTGHANAQAQQLANRTKYLYDNKADNEFLQSGIGAVARTVSSKLKDTVSVKDFGAVGDGVTDDTAAIQSAITFAGVSAAVFFPSGSYLITNRITLSDSQSIFGEGATSKIFGNAFLLNSYNNVHGLHFSGSGAISLSSNSSGSPVMSRISNCIFDAVSIGIELKATSGNWGAERFDIVNNTFRNCTTASVFSPRIFYCNISNNTSENTTGNNFLFFGGRFNTLSDNTTKGGITGIAFVYQRTSASNVGCITHNKISNNTIYAPSEEGISLDCRGNIANDIGALDYATVASTSFGGGTVNITMSEPGFATSGTKYNNYFACFVTGSMAGSSYRIGAHNNSVVSIGQTTSGLSTDIQPGDKFVIGAALTENVIIGNSVSNAGTAGIILWGLGYNNVISNNTLHGPGTMNTTLTATSQYAGGIEIASLNGLVVSTQSSTGVAGKAPSMGNIISGNNVFGANIRCGYKGYDASPTYTSLKNRVLHNNVVKGLIVSDLHTVTYSNNIATITGSDIGI